MKQSKSVIPLLLLAAMMTSGVLASCGEAAADNKPDVTAADTAPGTAAVTEAVTEDPASHDSIPALDFGGAHLRMAGQAYHVTNDMDMWIEAEVGDVVRDTIYQRNRAVEERFNIVIDKPLMDEYNNISTAVKNTVRAGEDAYDIVVNQLATSSADVLNGYYLNLNDVPYLDFSRLWYPAAVVESATLDDQLYLIVSDMCLTYVGQTWSMCFNKELAANYDIEDLYTLAREGKWTLDKLKELSSALYVDLNGDGQRNEEDLYGFTYGSDLSGCKAAAFVYGAGQRFLDVTEDHAIVNLLSTEKAQAAAAKLYDLNHMAGSANLSSYGNGNPIDAMMAGHAVFVPAQLTHYYNYARDFNGTFGVLPMPKYDENQKNYATLCDAGCNCITVPTTCTNLELAGAAIEAFSSYSHNVVVPAYVNLALQTKVARDEESVEMMQIVLDSRVMDFGYLYCGWTGWTWKLGDLLKDTGKYASTVEKQQKAMDKYYEKVIAQFEKDE